MHQTQWSPERPLPPPVSLASQSHHEKPPEVTCTSRGKPGFPASTRERPRETFFNTSRGQIPLPWLGSSDGLPLSTRMETRLPWRPTRGSLTSPEDWEVAAAEILESHLSYPILCYFRSQHDNQSWVSALATILDACALLLAHTEGALRWQAEL